MYHLLVKQRIVYRLKGLREYLSNGQITDEKHLNYLSIKMVYRKYFCLREVLNMLLLIETVQRRKSDHS